MSREWAEIFGLALALAAFLAATLPSSFVLALTKQICERDINNELVTSINGPIARWGNGKKCSTKKRKEKSAHLKHYEADVAQARYQKNESRWSCGRLKKHSQQHKLNIN